MIDKDKKDTLKVLRENASQSSVKTLDREHLWNRLWKEFEKQEVMVNGWNGKYRRKLNYHSCSDNGVQLISIS